MDIKTEKTEISLEDLMQEMKFIRLRLKGINEIKNDIENMELLLAHMNEQSDNPIDVPDSISPSLLKAIKAHLKMISLVSVPSLGVIVTILYEIGKYLRNLPVN